MFFFVLFYKSFGTILGIRSSKVSSVTFEAMIKLPYYINLYEYNISIAIAIEFCSRVLGYIETLHER